MERRDFFLRFFCPRFFSFCVAALLTAINDSLSGSRVQFYPNVIELMSGSAIGIDPIYSPCNATHSVPAYLVICFYRVALSHSSLLSTSLPQCHYLLLHLLSSPLHWSAYRKLLRATEEHLPSKVIFPINPPSSYPFSSRKDDASGEDYVSSQLGRYVRGNWIIVHGRHMLR